MSKRICAWEDCTSSNIFARGLCPKHLKRAQRSGRIAEFPVTSRRCFRCGVEFVAGNRGGKKFCSADCRLAQAKSDLDAARTAELSGRSCIRFGRAVPLSARVDAQHCSVRCQQSTWYDQNSEMLRERASAWKKANWELALEYEHKRRAATKAGLNLSREELLDRDGSRCYICGGRIEAELRHPDPKSPSLDHRIPLSRGGSHSEENVAIVHLRCNLVKGVKTPAELGLMEVV